ncbi:unnamed protein product [Laminaria digitata]
MDLIDRLESLAKQIPGQLEHIHTEEATKHSLVMPFLAALGYNVFDPREIVPEYTADVGVKKGEKVDYAIMREGKPSLLIECKAADVSLTGQHMSQLYRYFSVTDARIAVLTNGVVYKFFSDLDASNRMDEVPFLELNILELTEEVVRELKPLTKEKFNVDNILNSAQELKYSKAIRAVFDANLQEPDDEFIRFFVNAIEPDRRFIQSTKDFYRPLITKALRHYIKQRVSGRLNAALAQEDLEVVPSGLSSHTSDVEDDDAPADDGIITTEEELEGFYIVRAIMSEVVDSERVVMRDVKSYCGVLLDDNNRQPICRLHFNSSQKYLGVFDDEKNEEKMPIDAPSDIVNFRAQLQATASFYGATKSEPVEEEAAEE